MPFERKRATLLLTPEVQEELIKISKSRSERASRVERATINLLYAEGATISAIARELSTNRPKIERCVDKALQLGALASLDDLPRSGKPPDITPEAKAWLISIACQKPKDLGYSYELWTEGQRCPSAQNYILIRATRSEKKKKNDRGPSCLQTSGTHQRERRTRTRSGNHLLR